MPRPETLARRHQAFHPRQSLLVDRYREEIRAVARDDRPDSDIDLLVVFDGASPLDLAGLGQELESRLGRRVDIVSESGENDGFLSRIRQGSIPL